MRALLISLSILIFSSSSSFAEETAIQEVISAQIEAFKQNDVETAFTFASPKIQTMFRTPENFGRMVQSGYPMVWRPRDVTFLRQKANNGVVFQEMQFFDDAGIGHSFVYEMVVVSGSWKINGVFKTKASGVSA
ncbi:DUF4864 domain-containing protein [Pseudopelagicola sp. nBUS_20]|uniref:DUF4864 domain-containing protein n=1 Tax=Pseudopelagicola sp. nBUS_20 TaxID=3395317 RepID=UPI003EBF973C